MVARGRLAARASLAWAVIPGLAACAGGPLSASPGPPPAAVCSAAGCAGPAGAAGAESGRAASGFALCVSEKVPPCEALSAGECTDRTLEAWSRAGDDRDLGCVGQKLDEACKLGEPRACGYAGRMALSGRGLPRDVEGGIRMLTAACDAQIVGACEAAVKWLTPAERTRALSNGQAVRDRLDAERSCFAGEGDSCYRVGVGFYEGQGAFSRDLVLAVRAFETGCAIGNATACNRLGDALTYGEGARRDLHRAAQVFGRSCSLGEVDGCANLAYMLEHAMGVARDLSKARSLYVRACASGIVYGCLHQEMMAVRPPEDPARNLAQWQRACDAKDARACAFVGLLYADGPDGFSRDLAKSTEAMNKACELGSRRACEWTASHAP